MTEGESIFRYIGTPPLGGLLQLLVPKTNPASMAIQTKHFRRIYFFFSMLSSFSGYKRKKFKGIVEVAR
jgi:hypothetical protein